jgi:hypothetical protein
MKSEPFDHLKFKSLSSKMFSILLKILLVFLFGLCFLKVSDYIHCHTDTICDERPPITPELKATISADQYNMAIQDINSGRYDAAKQQLEYIIVLNKPTQYPNVQEKLTEVEKMIRISPTP